MTKIDANNSSSLSSASSYSVDLSVVQARIDALHPRAAGASRAVAEAVPVRKLSLAAQEAFILALSDTQFVRELVQKIDSRLRELKSSAGMFVVGTGNRFGVAEEVVIPATIKDLQRQLDLIESVINRLEAAVATFKAASESDSDSPGTSNLSSACSPSCPCHRYVPGEKLADDDPVIIAFSARRDLPSAGR